MKQLPSGKCTVAWFKLAEFISRGEKERALGLYRLLAHSIDDKALMSQLEGDILYSFDPKDPEAQEKYITAARLYKKEHRLREAAAIYEYLLSLNPLSDIYRTNTAELLCTLGLTLKAQAALTYSFVQALEKKNYTQAVAALKDFERLPDVEAPVMLYEQLTLAALADKHLPAPTLETYLTQTVELMLITDDRRLKVFLANIKALDAHWHKIACTTLDMEQQ